MKVIAILALIGTLLVISCSNKPEEERKYKPFPAGYGYMENLKELQAATDTGDKAVIRDHGWKLWAGIMQPDQDTGWPLWYSWQNTTAAFLPGQDDPQITPANPFISKSILAHNFKNAPVNTNSPNYCVPEEIKREYLHGKDTIGVGKHFQNNGDILIPTESLSQEAYDSIRNQKLYLKSTLDTKFKNKRNVDIPQRSIVTKHMYWPVKSEGLTALPVWQNQIKPSNPNYAGYEIWNTLVAIDPTGELEGQEAEVGFLYNVRKYKQGWTCASKEKGPDFYEPVWQKAKVYNIKDFYFHKVTKEDWASFDDIDKAIISAASLWANNQPFEPGDYLVTVAMHVNTKELVSWTMQSVWWADDTQRNDPNNPYGFNRPVLPNAQGPWQHYLMTDSYAIPPNDEGKMDIAVNPYIEGVIHPIATSCRNCHVRAGWPTAKDHRAGTASYQNPDCPELLAYITHETPCLKSLTHTDYLWIIPDRAIDH